MSVKLPEGCFPTMVTPMQPDGSIDWPRVDALAQWYTEAGCSGIFANCLSSEMFNLSDDEQVELTKRVRQAAGTAVTIVSTGTGLNKSTEEQAAHIKRIAETADAVVVVVNQMARVDEPDDVWRANVKSLLALTGDIPLGLYECPKPYHRLLSPETLQWAASTGRFLFHKDTCCRMEAIERKLEATRDLPLFRFYNANIATLLFSLKRGAAGFSGISANFYPQILVWLTANPTHPDAEEVQEHISVFENVVCDAYPTSAKYYQSLYDDFGGTVKCRTQEITLNDEQRLKLEALHRTSDALCKRVGIPTSKPPKPASS